MSQCPICNAAIWIGQRYCSTCDSYLPNPGEEDHFCPKCGIRVAPQQEICHKCNASLPEMAGAVISDADQGPEAPSLGHRHFHRHWFGHRGPPLSLPLQQKSRTSSADGAAALSTRFRTNSCYLAPQGRNSPFGSHGSCGPGTIRPISTSTPFSPGIDDTRTITAHIPCEHPLPGPPGWPHHVCTSDRHPQLQRRGGTPGHLGRMGEDSGGAAQSCRLVQYALFGAGDS